MVATDLTAELLAVGERHARERGLTLRWEVADAQALPFADGEFDAVLSSIGAIFAPDHAATARELLRVCRPGGIVVMANWTPDGGVGRFFELLGRYEPAGDDDGPSPLAWGVPVHVTALLEGADVQTEPRRLRLASPVRPTRWPRTTDGTSRPSSRSWPTSTTPGRPAGARDRRPLRREEHRTAR